MKKTKFEAIGKEIMIPDNCNFVDLGESTFFVDTITDFLHEKFSLIAVLDFIEDCTIRVLGGPKGECIPISYDRQDYIMIVYLPKELRVGLGVDPEFDYWRTRGHEEGHALLEMGLKDEVDKIIGRPYSSDDLEAVCDLVGLHAADIRGLGDRISYRQRCYYGRAVHAYERRKRIQKHDFSKDDTVELSREDLLIRFHELEGRV